MKIYKLNIMYKIKKILVIVIIRQKIKTRILIKIIQKAIIKVAKVITKVAKVITRVVKVI